MSAKVDIPNMGNFVSRLLRNYSGGVLGAFRRCPRRRREVLNEDEEPRAERQRVSEVDVSPAESGHWRPREASNDDDEEPRAQRPRVADANPAMGQGVDDDESDPAQPLIDNYIAFNAAPEHDPQAAPVATRRVT